MSFYIIIKNIIELMQKQFNLALDLFLFEFF